MTKRLYFTCPIKALYMMKEFGVKFECKYTPEEIAEYEPLHKFYDFDEAACESNTIEDFLEISKDFRKIYVAAESERIFKLQKEDLVNYKSRSGKNKITATYLESFVDCESILKWKLQSQGMNSPKIYKIDAREFLIIMRDNKQFFMPEVENER